MSRRDWQLTDRGRMVVALGIVAVIAVLDHFHIVTVVTHR